MCKSTCLHVCMCYMHAMPVPLTTELSLQSEFCVLNSTVIPRLSQEKLVQPPEIHE